MIPPIIAVVFLVASLGCFYYTFRGFGDDINPVLGSILATGINTVICGVFVMWFLNGAITDVHMEKNGTYFLGFTPTVAEVKLPASLAVSYINNSVGRDQYILQENGAGMYTVSTVDWFTVSPVVVQNFSISQFNVEYTTYDIFYLQYQEKALAYLFLLLTAINAALFLWFVFSSGWPAVKQFVGGSQPPPGENVG